MSSVLSWSANYLRSNSLYKYINVRTRTYVTIHVHTSRSTYVIEWCTITYHINLYANLFVMFKLIKLLCNRLQSGNRYIYLMTINKFYVKTIQFLYQNVFVLINKISESNTTETKRRYVHIWLQTIYITLRTRKIKSNSIDWIRYDTFWINAWT